MGNVQIRELGQALVDNRASVGQATVRRSEAQPGVNEIALLRADLDLLASPDSVELNEKLVSDFHGNITSGDQLRLPQLSNLGGPALRSAVNRVLANDNSVSGASQTLLAKEDRMRNVLRTLDNTVADIQRQAAMTVRY